MAKLEWPAKGKVAAWGEDRPAKKLKRVYSFDRNGRSERDNGSKNMIIKGDNLESLRALLPALEGKVDCVYIDPPYNTGKEEWLYNDAANDPRMRLWLGRAAGKQGERLSRQDRWLCMMFPRLKLLKRLLAEDGALVASIGAQELATLMLMLAELFPDSKITPVTVQTSGGKPSNGFSAVSEFLVFVTPRGFEPNALDGKKKRAASAYHGMTLATFGQAQSPNQAYPIYVDAAGRIVGVGKSLKRRIDEGLYAGDPADFRFDFDEAPAGAVAVWPITEKGKPCVWRLTPSSLEDNWRKGYIRVAKARASARCRSPWAIQYLSGGVVEKIESGEFSARRVSDDPAIPTLAVDDYKTAGRSIPTMWLDKGFFTAKGGREMAEIFGDKSAFHYPKPVELVMRVLQSVAKKDAVVLDSFAGSGTTAHAALLANKRDGGARTFVLCELGDYADKITAQRVGRAIVGCKTGAAKKKIVYSRKLAAADLANGPQILAQAKAAAARAARGAGLSKVGRPKIETVWGEGGCEARLVVAAQTGEEDELEAAGGDFSYYELEDPGQ